MVISFLSTIWKTLYWKMILLSIDFKWVCYILTSLGFSRLSIFQISKAGLFLVVTEQRIYSLLHDSMSGNVTWYLHWAHDDSFLTWKCLNMLKRPYCSHRYQTNTYLRKSVKMFVTIEPLLTVEFGFACPGLTAFRLRTKIRNNIRKWLDTSVTVDLSSIYGSLRTTLLTAIPI